MNEYEYIIEVYALKSLRVKADDMEKADEIVNTVITTQTIPVTQEDIVGVSIMDTYEIEDSEEESHEKQ